MMAGIETKSHKSYKAAKRNAIFRGKLKPRCGFRLLFNFIYVH